MTPNSFSTDDALDDIAIVDASTIPPDEGDSGSGAPVEGLVVEGLAPADRASAQRVIANGARMLLNNASAVHYTQGPSRWEGIAQRLYVRDGHFPRHGDCSSTATWLLWNGLFAHLGMADVVNGQNWRGGYTGTMLDHGHKISESVADVGDLVIYGSGTGSHVVVCLGGGVAFSHGSEEGPFKLNIHYRNDIQSIRRYF